MSSVFMRETKKVKKILLTLHDHLHLISFSINSDMRTATTTGELRERDADGLLDRFCQRRQSGGPHPQPDVDQGKTV